MTTIKTDMLSKASLVTIMDVMREKKIIREPLIVTAYKQALTDQCHAIKRQMDAIDKQLEDKKLSRKAYAGLIKKFNQLCRLVNKKVALLKELEEA